MLLQGLLIPFLQKSSNTTNTAARTSFHCVRRRRRRRQQQPEQTTDLSASNITPNITDNSLISATQRQEEGQSGSTSVPSSLRVSNHIASNSVVNMRSQVKIASRPISIISASGASERMDSAVALVDDQGDVVEVQKGKGKAIVVAGAEGEEKEELTAVAKFVDVLFATEEPRPIDVIFESAKGKDKVDDDCVVDEDQIAKKEAACHFDKLPLEIKVKIFKCLDVFQVIRAAMVCRAWYSLAFDGSLWSRLDVAPFYQRIETDQLIALWKTAGGFLKEVNFRGCVQLNPLDLREMAPYCPNIQKLQLSGCRNLDFGSVDFLLQHLHNLEELDLSGLLFIINPTCYTLAKECKRLKKVKLSWCQYIDFRGIKQLVKGCKELVSLKLDGLPKLNEPALSMIGELRHLRILSLDSCPTVDDASIAALFQSGSNDNSSTVACTMTTYSLSPPPITHLNLSNNRNLTDAALQDLADFCPNLTHLQVHSCPGFTDHGLIYLTSKCVRLQAIDLEDCSTAVNDDVLNAFATHLRKLRIICLSYCELITDDGVTNLLRECTNLARIDLDQCPSLTDRVLRNITSILTTAASMGLVAGTVAATTADSASHSSLYDDGASSISGDSERRQLSALARNGIRPRFIEIEIFDCRNISILAVRQTVKQVNAAGVFLKVKGYYAWQTPNPANNNNNDVGIEEDDDDDNVINRSFWSRIRPFRHLRGADLWPDFATRFQFQTAFRGTGPRGMPRRRLRQCTIL